MWPWEHAVVGYLAYSVLLHLVFRRAPTGPEAVVVVVVSSLPDLIDKPLAWEFGVFPSGYGLGHSVFFAVPLSVAVLAAAAYYGRAGIGGAFAVGYLSHLAADVLPRYVRDGSLPVEIVLWPVATAESSYPGGFSGTLVSYASDYFSEILSGEPSGYLVTVAGMLAVCLFLWVYDGMPGLREPVRYLRGRV